MYRLQANPWGIRFMTMFHMSNDSHLFADEAGPGLLPLYEAKMMHQFDHRWATYTADGKIRDITEQEKSIENLEILSRYWVAKSEVLKRLTAVGWSRKWLIAWRRNCRSTDERTCIATVLPLAAAGDSCFLMLPSVEDDFLAAALIANLNSLVFDFVTRQKVGGMNFSFYLMKQLPFIRPEAYTDETFNFILNRVLKLIYNSLDQVDWANDLGFRGAVFPWCPDQRQRLRAELDAYYARLYGLTRDELRYILDPADVMGHDYPSETFRGLKNNEMRDFGEYRTQRLVLEAWDKLEAGELH